MTTFTNRKLIIDELRTLAIADGSWQDVYDYVPNTDDLQGKTPVLVILSIGTRRDMAGLNTNPTSHLLEISSWVLGFSQRTADAWSAEDAENKAHELEMKLSQLIRDNAGGGTNADSYEFDTAFSSIDRITFEGVPYIVETRRIVANQFNGA